MKHISDTNMPDAYNSGPGGIEMSREELIDRLVAISYDRNDVNFVRDKFRVRGDTVEVFPASSGSNAIRVEFFG